MSLKYEPWQNSNRTFQQAVKERHEEEPPMTFIADRTQHEFPLTVAGVSVLTCGFHFDLICLLWQIEHLTFQQAVTDRP